MTSKILIKNSFSGALQIIINTVLTFVCIKYFIKFLGIELYGVFSVLSILGNINIFANLGLNYSLVKFLSSQGKSKESDHDIIVAFIILSSILIPISIILFIFKEFILLKILNIPLDYYDQSSSLYYLLIVSNVLVLIGVIINAVLDSQQKIYINNILQLIYSFLYWFTVLVILYLGYSLKEIGYGILIVTILWFSLEVYFFIKYWGFPDFTGIRENFVRILKKQLNYSLKIYFSSTISFFYEPLTKIILANFIGVAYVGYFDIALKIRTGLWNFISKILHPLFPYMAQLKDKDKISFIVNDIEKKMLYFIIPLIFITVFVSKPFVNIWINMNQDIISISIIMIVVFFMINIVGIPNYQYLLINHANKTIVFQLLNVVVNFSVFFLLYSSMQYYALLISFNLSMLATFLLTIYYQKKYLKTYIFDSLDYAYKLIILSVNGFIGGFLINYFIDIDILKIVVLLLYIALSTIIIYKKFNYFSENDLTLYFKDTKRIKTILGKLLLNN